MIQSTTLCTSFKEELAAGTHDLESDTLKLALFDSSWTGDSTTTAYSTTNEISGTGYTAGGVTLTNVSVVAVGDGTYRVTSDAVAWTSSVFTFRKALLYNSTNSNKAIAIYDFGSDVGVSDSLTITPSSAASSTSWLGF